MYQNENIRSAFGELIEPEPVIFSYNAPGWYVVFGLIVLVFVVMTLVWIRKYRINRYRREALQYLKSLVDQQDNALHLIYEAHFLLKKIMLEFQDRSKVASLTGIEWIDLLNDHCKSPVFDEQDNLLIHKMIYSKPSKYDIVRIKNHLIKTQTWIKIHKN